MTISIYIFHVHPSSLGRSRTGAAYLHVDGREKLCSPRHPCDPRDLPEPELLHPLPPAGGQGSLSPEPEMRGLWWFKKNWVQTHYCVFQTARQIHSLIMAPAQCLRLPLVRPRRIPQANSVSFDAPGTISFAPVAGSSMPVCS